jgi:hypothetical protein
MSPGRHRLVPWQLVDVVDFVTLARDPVVTKRLLHQRKPHALRPASSAAVQLRGRTVELRAVTLPSQIVRNDLLRTYVQLDSISI